VFSFSLLCVRFLSLAISSDSSQSTKIATNEGSIVFRCLSRMRFVLFSLSLTKCLRPDRCCDSTDPAYTVWSLFSHAGLSFTDHGLFSRSLIRATGWSKLTIQPRISSGLRVPRSLFQGLKSDQLSQQLSHSMAISSRSRK